MLRQRSSACDAGPGQPGRRVAPQAETAIISANRPVIGPETVGATALEVLVGTIAKTQGAKPHAHPHLEQCAYMMEGTGESQAEGRVEVMEAGTEVAEDLDGALERLLSRLQSNSPTALRRGLYAMKAMRAMSFEEAIAFGEGQIGLLALTQDAREGIAAFKDTRKPQWTGK